MIKNQKSSKNLKKLFKITKREYSPTISKYNKRSISLISTKSKKSENEWSENNSINSEKRTRLRTKTNKTLKPRIEDFLDFESITDEENCFKNKKINKTVSNYKIILKKNGKSVKKKNFFFFENKNIRNLKESNVKEDFKFFFVHFFKSFYFLFKLMKNTFIKKKNKIDKFRFSFFIILVIIIIFSKILIFS